MSFVFDFVTFVNIIFKYIIAVLAIVIKNWLILIAAALYFPLENDFSYKIIQQ